MRENYGLTPFKIQTIKLERIFADKILAAEFYYDRELYFDAAKHVYDVSIMLDLPSIRALLEAACRDAGSVSDLGTKEFKDALESASNTMKTDITMYGPDGKVFDSTTPEIFDRQLLGCRVNQIAYHNITH